MQEHGALGDGKAAVHADNIDGVGVLTISDPARHNALDSGMWRQLAGSLDRMRHDDAVHAIVLTGAGYLHFATGTPDWEQALPVFEALADCPRPVIARVRGECLGSGLVLALAADLRVAAFDCAFGLPWQQHAATIPRVVIDRLVALVGPGQTARLAMVGERIEAAEALRIGLVETLVPDAELSDRVADLAKSLYDSDAAYLGAVKQGIARAVRGP